MTTLLRAFAFTALSLALLTGCGGPEKKDESSPRSARPPKGERRKTLFVTEPKGAQVFVNGQPIGNTPCNIELPDKKRLEITVKKDGYWTITDEYDQPIDGWPTSQAYRLQRKIR